MINITNQYNLDDFNSLNVAIQYFEYLKLSQKSNYPELSPVFDLIAVDIENSIQYENSRNLELDDDFIDLPSSINPNPFPPDIRDLMRLHWLVMSTRSSCILELGCGYSTIILALAMYELKSYFAEQHLNQYRNTNPFHVYSVDQSSEFIQITKNRLGKYLNACVTFNYAEVDVVDFHYGLASCFTVLPDICPDFIYVDAPSLIDLSGDVGGLSFNYSERFPLSIDVLRYEYQVEPGTIILFDGRTTNARLIRNHFSRAWVERHLLEGDVTILELQEKPIGLLNHKRLSEKNGGNFILK